jgi:hypothetical protein
MRLDLNKVRANVAQASTEDLLDRATVYRQGMEPEALALIDEELRARGVGPAELAAHAERRQGALPGPVPCEKCRRPAVVCHRGWHRLWGLVPIFPRTLAYCQEHRPQGW